MSTRTPIRLGETTLERRARPPWKDLMPKEHGVWAWITLPLVMALCLAPTWSTLFGSFAVVIGFGAAQGFGRALAGARRAAVPTLLALLAANALGAVAVALAPSPAVVLVTLGAGGLVGFAAMGLMRGRAPRSVALELAVITALLAIAAGLAWGGGAGLFRVIAAALALGAWLITGLWWVKGLLARVLSHRTPWHHGRWFAAASMTLSIIVGLYTEHLFVGLVPLLYLGRVMLHPAPAKARDAKRVGLTELAWGLVAALLVGLL